MPAACAGSSGARMETKFTLTMSRNAQGICGVAWAPACRLSQTIEVPP